MKPKLFLTALCLTALFLTNPLFADITCVDRPAQGTEPAHYVGNRAPLQPSPFLKLPVGSVRAEGWIGRYLELQRDGLTGHLGEISRWLDKKDNAWLTAGGKHGWEEVPYWLKGYGNLGYLLNDEKIIAEAKIWIEAILTSQRADGFFGPGNPDAEKGMDLWPNMIALFIIQSYYEYNHMQGDKAEQKRCLDFMTKYFRFIEKYPDEKFLETYWEHLRGGDLLLSCFWLYNRTGDKFLLDVAGKIHRNTANWGQQTLPNWHNVNIAQGLREPATWWMLSGKNRDKRATYDNFWLIRACYGQVPGGMFGSDENCRPGYIDPRQGVETCGMVEQMSSDAFLTLITGDPAWADNCEDVAFNTYPASFTPDFKALRYFTCPNHVVSDSKNHHPGIDNRGPFLMMNPFSSRCCQHNHAQGWPYYTEHLWMATPDRGVAAILYNACTVTAKVGNGTEVSIKSETKYPFEETVNLTVATPNDVTFPLYLRVPKWCDDMSIAVNGENLNVQATPQKYVKIDRQWKNGDRVAVTMPMRWNVRSWQQNKNSISLDYGPLTFSLKIKENNRQMSSRETALHDSGWQDGADESRWPAFEILPGSDWNYGLEPLVHYSTTNTRTGVTKTVLRDAEIERKPWPADDYPWTADAVPLSVKVKGRKIPGWKIDRYGLCAPLPQSPAVTAEPVEEVELIPMGAARLRISAFPIVREPWPGEVIEPADDDEEERFDGTVGASHCHRGDSIEAVCDGILPLSSGDASVPRLTFWPHRGTEEWIEMRFNEPKTVSKTSVYWYDDGAKGFCRLPESWSVSYLAGDDWKTVSAKSPCATTADGLNTVEFEPIETQAIRLNVKLRDGFSGGVVEMKAE